MTEREALKLALEALKQIDEAMPFPVAKLAQKAIKEALAQPEHSCVACEGNPKGNNNPCAVCGLAQPEQTVHREMQPIQKPICWANINKQGDVTHTQNKRGSWAKTPLYTSPSNYKPLTSEEYSILAEKYTGADGLDCVDYGRAIARHYGIKE